jgi:hypothetical protein
VIFLLAVLVLLDLDYYDNINDWIERGIASGKLNKLRELFFELYYLS